MKTLKESAGEKERKDLLQELEVMKSLEPHPNIVRLLGCCTKKGTNKFFFFLIIKNIHIATETFS